MPCPTLFLLLRLSPVNFSKGILGKPKYAFSSFFFGSLSVGWRVFPCELFSNNMSNKGVGKQTNKVRLSEGHESHLYLLRYPHSSLLTTLHYSLSSSTPQPSQLITGCVNPTLTTRGVTTLAFTAHASQTTRPTCSAATTTTLLSSTAATRLSSRWSCRSTSPPPQMDMHTSESFHTV